MNKYLVISFATLILCQVLKFVIESIKNKKLIWARIINGAGGMPSSHTSFAVSLTTSIGLNESTSSISFAIAVVFTCIVIFDAMSVRLETEKQAETINSIVEKIFSKDSKAGFEHLKEEVGHEPIEVFAGIIFGIICGFLFNLIF